MNFERPNNMSKAMTVKVYIENYNHKRVNIATLYSEDGKNQSVTITSELVPNYFKQAFKHQLTESAPQGPVTTEANANEINKSHNTDSGNVQSQPDSMQPSVPCDNSIDVNSSISPDSGRPASEGNRSPIDLAKNVNYIVEDFLNEVGNDNSFENGPEDTQRIAMTDNPIGDEADGESNGEDSDCENSMEEYFIVDKLVGSRFNNKTQKYEFLLRPKQCTPKNESWNPISDCENCDISLLEYGRLYVEAPESLKPIKKKRKKQNVLKDKFLSEGNIAEVACDTDDGDTMTLNRVKTDDTQMTNDHCQRGIDNKNNTSVNSCPTNISDVSLELEMPHIESNFQEMVLMEPVDLVQPEYETTKITEEGAVKVPSRKTAKGGPKSKRTPAACKGRVRFIKEKDSASADRITCISCTFSTMSNEAMKRHVRRHLNPQWNCPHCGRGFLAQIGLSRHKERFHSDEVDNETTSAKKPSPLSPCMLPVNKAKRRTRGKRENERGSCESIYFRKYKNESSKRKKKRMLAYPDPIQEEVPNPNSKRRGRLAKVLTDGKEETETQSTSTKTEACPAVQVLECAANEEKTILPTNEVADNVTQDSECTGISPLSVDLCESIEPKGAANVILCENIESKDTVSDTKVQCLLTIADGENAGMDEDQSIDVQDANSILCEKDQSCKPRTVDVTDECTNDLPFDGLSEVSEEIVIVSASPPASPNGSFTECKPKTVEDAEVSDDSMSNLLVNSDSSDPDYEVDEKFLDIIERPRYKRRRPPKSQQEKRFKPDYGMCSAIKALPMDSVLIKSENRDVLNCRPVGFQVQGPFSSDVDGQNNSLYNGGSFMCSSCDITFARNEELVLHKIKHHNLDKKLCKCLICHAKYLSNNALTQHYLKRHGLKDPLVLPIVLLHRIDDESMHLT